MTDGGSVPNPELDAAPSPSHLDVVRELAVRLLRRNSPAELVWEIADTIGRLPEFQHCVIYLKDGDLLIQAAAYGLKLGPERTIVNPITIPVGEGVVGTAAATQQTQVVTDTREDPRYIRDEYAGLSELAVPIVSDGCTIGVLDSESTELNRYGRKETETFEAMANICASRLATALAHEELERLTATLEDRVRRRTAELEAARDALALDRNRLQTILRTVHSGLIAADAEHRIRLVNPYAEELLRVRESDWIGRPVGELFLPLNLKEADTLFGPRYLDDGLQSGMVRTAGGTGDAVDVNWTVASAKSLNIPSENPADDPLYYVIALHDVTQQNLLMEEAARAQRLESLGVLAGGLAHDFNNYLLAIQSSVHTIKFGTRSDITEGINIALTACQQSQQLTAQLQNFAKGRPAEPRAISLESAISTAVSLTTGGTSVAVERQLPANLPPVWGDETAFVQVLTNLLLNAVQAMGENGRITIEAEVLREDEVELSSSLTNDYIEITIRDFGPGIDAELLPSIFDPYVTRRHGGTGLGLATAWMIVNRHGGHLLAGNHPQGGMEFILCLPAAPRDAAETPLAEQARTLHFLLMDDDPMVLRGLKKLLESMGHTATTTDDGEAALRRLRELQAADQTPDIAILDLVVSRGIGGADVIRSLKETAPQLLCIATSGFHDAEVMGRYREFSFDAALEKPFSIQDLRTLIDELAP